MRISYFLLRCGTFWDFKGNFSIVTIHRLPDNYTTHGPVEICDDVPRVPTFYPTSYHDFLVYLAPYKPPAAILDSNHIWLGHREDTSKLEKRGNAVITSRRSTPLGRRPGTARAMF